jgi:drug/metabolite transporter (DMT)-like permease
VTLFGCDAVFVTPYVLLHRELRQIREVWRGNRGPLLCSGLLALAAYLLVLIAMRLTQVSYVAALRESSVILGAILGWRVLGDPFGGQRVSASAIVAVGLILLALVIHG